jgi:hypothetical protein
LTPFFIIKKPEKKEQTSGIASLTGFAVNTSISTVKAQKMNVLVLYEDEEKELISLAQELKAGLGAEHTVKVRPVSEMAISELLAAQVLLLGVKDMKNQYWQEFTRLMQGINLAGRSLAFFSANSSKTADAVKVIEPTDITIEKKAFSDSRTVLSWLETLTPFTS